MRAHYLWLLALGLNSLVASPAFALKVGDWDVVAYPSSGAKNGCIMTGTYQDNTKFSVMVTKEYKWGIGFFNGSWKLAPDGSTPATLIIDGVTVTSGTAKHLGKDLAYLPLGGSAAYTALQKGYSLDVVTPIGKLNFQLSGTARAMAAVLECVDLVNGKTPSTPLSPPASQPAAATFQLVSQAESLVLLTNLLNASGVAGYRLERPAADSNAARFTLPDGSEGRLIAARGNTKSADDYANVLIETLSKDCKGDFVSGRQNLPTTDGSVARKVVSTCKTGQNVKVTESTVLRYASGYLMNLSLTLPENIQALEAGAYGKDRKSLTDAVMQIGDRR